MTDNRKKKSSTNISWR